VTDTLKHAHEESVGFIVEESPHIFEPEKVLHPFFLFTQKSYLDIKYGPDGGGKGKIDSTGIRIKKKGIFGITKKAGNALQPKILRGGRVEGEQFLRGVIKLLKLRVAQYNNPENNDSPITVDGLDFTIDDKDFVNVGNIKRPLDSYGSTAPKAVAVARKIAAVNKLATGTSKDGYVSGTIATPGAGAQVPFVSCVVDARKAKKADKAVHPDAVRRGNHKLDIKDYLDELHSSVTKLLSAYHLPCKEIPDERQHKKACADATTKAVRSLSMTQSANLVLPQSVGTLVRAFEAKPSKRKKSQLQPLPGTKKLNKSSGTYTQALLKF
jgi:DNA polymerase elongation subunit (family B)